MKSFIFQVLSKGLLLMVLAVVVAGYYYRVELFPNWFDDSQQVVNPAPVAEATEVPAVATTDDSTPDAAESMQAVAEDSAPVFRPLDTEEPRPVDAPAEPSAENPPEIVPVTQVVAVADRQVVAPAVSLTEARQAYWARDLEAAVAAYQRVISENPENADAHGELGNVYFAKRDAAAAAQAYLDAGLLLSKQGRPDEAASLVAVLQRLDVEKAAALSSALTGK